MSRSGGLLAKWQPPAPHAGQGVAAPTHRVPPSRSPDAAYLQMLTAASLWSSC